MREVQRERSAEQGVGEQIGITIMASLTVLYSGGSRRLRRVRCSAPERRERISQRWEMRLGRVLENGGNPYSFRKGC